MSLSPPRPPSPPGPHVLRGRRAPRTPLDSVRRPFIWLMTVAYVDHLASFSATVPTYLPTLS